MLIVMPPLSASQRGAAIRRSSIDPIDIEMRIAAITVLQKQEEVEDKSHNATTKGSPTSFTGRVVPHFPGEDFPDPLTAVSAIDVSAMSTMSASVVDDYNAATQASVCTLTPAAAGPVIEAHMMQLHAMRHYPLIDQHYFSQQECYLNKTILKWEFDVLKLEESSAQGVLKDVCLKLVEHHGLIDEFSLSLVSLHQTFQLIQGSYHNNPYHNAAHAADVVQAACCLIAEHKIWEHMTMLEKLAMIMAGACHDLDHPGVNQAFLKTTNHYLTEAAKKYPDGENTSLDSKPNIGAETTAAAVDEANVMSVLEIHHIRHAVAIFDQTQVFAHFSEETYLELLRLIRELILATDMAFQGRYMEKLKRLNKEYNSLDKEDDRNSFFACEETRRFYLQISLKCADICNTCRPWEVSQKWSRRVTEEFFSQGDKERVLSLPINEINDRTRTTIEKVQVGFLKFVARPLFAEWNNMHNSDLSLSLIKNIDDNLANWSFVQNKNQEIISTKAASAAPAINFKETSKEQDSSSPGVHVDRDVATVVVTSAQCDESSSGEVVEMHPEPPSSVPNLPSVESMLDRPLKPTDLISETSTVQLDQIGAAPSEVDELHSHQQQRKRSIPCAFVSLDHSVAIIQDNLRIQSEGTFGATAKVTRDRVTPVPTAEEDSKCEDYNKQHSQGEHSLMGDDVEERKEPADEPTASKHISSDQLDLPAVVRSSPEEESSSRNIDLLPQTYSSYSLIKPQSEILESDPPGQINSSVPEIIPNDYEKELLHKLKYSPFDPELLAEVAKLSTEGRQRLDALSRQQESTPAAGTGGSGRKSPSQSKYADSGTFTVDPSSTSPTSFSSTLRDPANQVPTTDQMAEDDPDLNAYAKLTSPPPYRKSIMLTVDKSLERLRAMHAKSKGGGGVGSEDFENSRLTKAVAYEKARLSQVKVRTVGGVGVGKAAAGEEESKDSSRETTKSHAPPKKTTSQRSETFFLPSSTSMYSDEVLTPDGSMGSTTSPEYYRKKINQSRSNFFQSLLPTALLKANVPSNSSTGGAKSSMGSPLPSPGSHNTSASLCISSPRNKTSSGPSSGGKYHGDSRVLTESSDALCDGGHVNAVSQPKSRTTHVLDHELVPNGPAEATDHTGVICRQNSDMGTSGESFGFVIQSQESSTPHVSSRTSGDGTTLAAAADSGRRPSRSTHPGSMSEKASAKRSQSASARLAKTFQKFFTGGSRPQTHRGVGGSSSNRNAPSKGGPSSVTQKPTSASYRGVESSSSKGATAQLRQEKSVHADCSPDLKTTKNNSAFDNEEQLR